MSLINDALKRAESEKRAAQSSASTPPLQPVESAPTHSTSPLLLGGVFLLGLGAIGIAAALWFGGRTTQVVQVPATSPIPTDRSAQVSTETQPAATTITSTPVAIAAPAPQPAAKPITATPPPPTTAKAAPLITSPTTTTTQTKPIRLQSIFYRLKNPTVIINGKTLGVGDTFEDIKVVSIQRTSVEIVQNGKYRTLTLQY